MLLVGATGAFGSRLAGHLAGIAGLDLVLTARALPPLERLCATLAPGAAATLSVAAFDRACPDLAALAPDIVVDAAGPFQGGDTVLTRAAIAAGAHAIDLADARAYVAAFPAALDGPAKARGVLAVAGASSTPALSHAVLDELVAGWRAVDTIRVAILPGARAPRGLAVMQAILSWTGRPVRVFRDGGWGEAPGWSGPRRLYVPGLRARFASLCETPDLDLLPARFAVRREALFLAGLEVPAMHLGLWLLSWLVRLGLVRSLVPAARWLRGAAGPLSVLGSDRGGMLVEADGCDGEGRRIRARWSLVAEQGCGPHIPGAPAAALVRALHEGRETRTGARACVGLLTRDAILAELAGLPVTTRTDESFPDDPALFRRLLGRRFDALPAPVRAVHGAPGVFAGRAVARTGRSLVARASCRLLGLPRSGLTSASVEIVRDGDAEIWSRRFGAGTFRTRLAPTRHLGLFDEIVGPLRLRFDLRPTEAGVCWRLVGWRLGLLPLPSALAPRVLARGGTRGDGYGFTVVVAHRLLGLVFAYRGRLDGSASLSSRRRLRSTPQA